MIKSLIHDNQMGFKLEFHEGLSLSVYYVRVHAQENLNCIHSRWEKFRRRISIYVANSDKS